MDVRHDLEVSSLDHPGAAPLPVARTQQETTGSSHGRAVRDPVAHHDR